MNLIENVTNAGKALFGYNAIEANKGKRQTPATKTKHENAVLPYSKRKKMNATAQEQMRNHALCAWMIRKHLDYVSKFHVSIRTGKDEIDTMLNQILSWHGTPENLDIAGRLGRDEMFRLYELEKVVNGDAGLIKLDNVKLQGLESDLIAKGNGAPEEVGDSGLIVDKQTGRRQQFSICNRGDRGTSIDFDHLEPAENIIFDGYWSRLTSQYRGISPLTTALNTVQDISEALEYNLVKAKMHALFGITIEREAEEDSDIAANDEEDDTTTDSNVTLNPTGFMVMDLQPGEKANTIESGTPSTEFVEGTYLFVHMAMLALDIPITCFDSRRSSFSARIADLNEYEVSTDSKRTKNKYVRQAYSNWLLEEIWNGGYMWDLRSAAGRAGMSLMDVQKAVEWIASGSPWLDKYKQMQGDALAIDRGADNIIDVCRRRGFDYFDNIEKQSKAEAYAKANGISLIKGGSGQRSIEEIIAAEVESLIANKNTEGAGNE